MVKPPRHPQLRDNVESHRGCRAGRPGGVPREGQVGTPSPVPAPAMTIILEMTCAGTANPVKRLSREDGETLRGLLRATDYPLHTPGAGAVAREPGA